MSPTEGMDRIIEKRGLSRRKKWLIALAVFFLVIVIPSLTRHRSSKLNVEKDKVSIGEVVFGKYQDFISVNGIVEPFTTVYLDAVESGRVEEILIDEGPRVRKGDVILRLSNYNLLLDISGNEAEVSRAVNDLKTARINLENQQLQTRASILELQYSLKALERQLQNNQKLFEGNYISREEFELSKEKTEEARLQLELLKQKYVSDSLYIRSRLESDEESIERMQNNLVLTRRRLANLEIRAPVDGELATLNPEIGQVIGYGTRMGTINVLDAYKMRVTIDEHYITRIARGLKGEFNFAGASHILEISKVYPEVSNGSFVVDMEFTGEVPSQIRIGQTARIRLELGESDDALLLPKGGFYQSTGGQWVYVVDPSGDYATRRDIQLGRQNPNFYEVLGGLSAGEKVVISGYESFGNADKMIFK